ncbi:MAG: hypothetical protein SGILL_004293 [Bacillariaceae sp.]
MLTESPDWKILSQDANNSSKDAVMGDLSFYALQLSLSTTIKSVATHSVITIVLKQGKTFSMNQLKELTDLFVKGKDPTGEDLRLDLLSLKETTINVRTVDAFDIFVVLACGACKFDVSRNHHRKGLAVHRGSTGGTKRDSGGASVLPQEEAKEGAAKAKAEADATTSKDEGGACSSSEEEGEFTQHWRKMVREMPD